jgi:triacylglycerol lipase
MMSYPVFASADYSDINEEYVILLHGLRRTSSSMKKIEKHLSLNGYSTININYPSTSGLVSQLTEKYINDVVDMCLQLEAKKIHFVTHSLGGILVRKYLQDHDLPNGSRMVMLAPPNHGSEVVDRLKSFWFFRWYNGPAGMELGTEAKSTPNRLKPINIEIGIIAGKRSLNPFFSFIIPGSDDGKVSIQKTKLNEMKDFIVVSNSHTFIMHDNDVLKQVYQFLTHGTFAHNQKI